jgi:hypothetical protein
VSAIPFDQINAVALASLPSLLSEWLPAGKRRGNEYVLGDIYGSPGRSFSINLRTCKWADFSTDAKGGDPISLAAALFHNGDRVAAARDLGKKLGVYMNGAGHQPAPQLLPQPPQDDDGWEDGRPPDGAKPPSLSRFDSVWPYRDENGFVVRYVGRIDEVGSVPKKYFPITWGTLEGVIGWHIKHPKGRKCLYGLDRLAANQASEVLLCEGEKSADAAQAMFPEMPCITWSAGTGNVKYNDWSPLADRRVIIWPDNDPAGHKAAAELSVILKDIARKIDVIRVDDFQEGADAADVILDDPDGWLKERLAEANPTPPTELPLIWFNDIEPCLDVRDFVQGVLVEEGAAVVYGESNAGKTFWTTDLALHVAAGLPWNGRRVEQGGVVYCVLEGGAGFRNRVSAWRTSHHMDGAQIPFAAIPSSLNLLDPEADTPKLISTVKAAAIQISHPVKLIVVDTLSRALAGGNENSPEDMGALVQNMDAIRAQTNAAVVFVHHSGKDSAKGARGHSLLRAAVDTEIEVVASDEGEEKSATIVKQRELKKGDVFGFTLSVAELGTNRHGESVTTCLVAPCDPPAKKAKEKRLNPGAALAVRALRTAMDKSGAYLPATQEYPAKTFGVAVSAWRNEFYGMKDDGPEANKKAFSRAETELLASSVITIINGLVWFVKRQEGEGVS